MPYIHKYSRDNVSTTEHAHTIQKGTYHTYWHMMLILLCNIPIWQVIGLCDRYCESIVVVLKIFNISTLHHFFLFIYLYETIHVVCDGGTYV